MRACLLRSPPHACQSRRKQWRMKKVRRGSYSLPARVVICKLTHHVNSALHVPQQKGGISSARSTATLALCQRHARHALAGTDGKDSWILMIGAANADSKYSHEYLHGQAEWRQHVAGRLLACAKADQLLRPEQAKAKFSRYRADTGIKFLHSALLFVCAAIFVLSAMLPRRKGKSACCWPKRFVPQTRLRTLAAPVATFRAYCSLELCEVAQCCPGAMHHCSTFPAGVANGCGGAGGPATMQTNCKAAHGRRRTHGGQVCHKTFNAGLRTMCFSRPFLGPFWHAPTYCFRTAKTHLYFVTTGPSDSKGQSPKSLRVRSNPGKASRNDQAVFKSHCAALPDLAGLTSSIDVRGCPRFPCPNTACAVRGRSTEHPLAPGP